MTIAERVKSLMAWGRRRPPNEALDHEWMEVEAVWQDRKALAPELDATRAAALDRLFYDANGARRPAVGWSEVNMAERALARELTAPQLCAQYAALLGIASRRNLPASTYPTTLDFAGKPDDDKREIYTTLLYALQSAFMDGRYVRRLRSEVSVTIFRYGVCVVIVALSVPLLWVRQTSLELDQVARHAGTPGPVYIDETLFALAAAGALGALGAFFSRAMRFQADLPKLDFDTVIQTYVAKMLRLRILYGMIGAVVFYLVMRGAFVGGNLFPTLSAGMISDQTVWQLGMSLHPVTNSSAQANNAGGPVVTTALAPAEQLAKLLFWSFLAGFSERLVPDTLLRLEKKSSDAAGKVG